MPALAAITADKIRVSPGAMKHIANIFLKRLYDLNLNVEELDSSFERKLIEEIRRAITRGIVVYNHQSDDTHNPLDRQLEIYTYVNLPSIDPQLQGVARLTAVCRLSVFNNMLSLRTISRNFQVE